MDFKQYIKLDEAMRQGSGQGVVGKAFGSLVGGMRKMAQDRLEKKKEDERKGMDPNVKITGPGRLNQPGIRGRLVGAAGKIKQGAVAARDVYRGYRKGVERAGQAFAHPQLKDPETGKLVIDPETGKPKRDRRQKTYKARIANTLAQALATHEAPLRTLVGGEKIKKDNPVPPQDRRKKKEKTAGNGSTDLDTGDRTAA